MWKVILKIMKPALWIISMFGIFLFIGVFKEGLALYEKIILGLLCLAYGIAPLLMSRSEHLQEIVNDSRNMIILALGGLMLIYCISEALSFGFFSLEAMLALFVGTISMGLTISFVIPKHIDQAH